MDTKDMLRFISGCASSEIGNYAIPGLSSHMLDKCKLRLFSIDRQQQEPIAPHNHRFDFTAIVLKGSVVNRVWRKTMTTEEGDAYQVTTLEYMGEPGVYYRRPAATFNWVYSDNLYTEGDSYSMMAEQFHSITFSKGARVLFFEGHNFRKESQVLDPVVNGRTIPTSASQEWMFLREQTVNQ